MSRTLFVDEHHHHSNMITGDVLKKENFLSEFDSEALKALVRHNLGLDNLQFELSGYTQEEVNTLLDRLEVKVNSSQLDKANDIRTYIDLEVEDLIAADEAEKLARQQGEEALQKICDRLDRRISAIDPTTNGGGASMELVRLAIEDYAQPKGDYATITYVNNLTSNLEFITQDALEDYATKNFVNAQIQSALSEYTPSTGEDDKPITSLINDVLVNGESVVIDKIAHITIPESPIQTISVNGVDLDIVENKVNIVIPEISNPLETYIENTEDDSKTVVIDADEIQLKATKVTINGKDVATSDGTLPIDPNQGLTEALVRSVIESYQYTTTTEVDAKITLANHATKSDLDSLATKEDIKDFVVEGLLSSYLTNADLNNYVNETLLENILSDYAKKNDNPSGTSGVTEEYVNNAIANSGHVTSLDIESLQTTITNLLSRIATLEALHEIESAKIVIDEPELVLNDFTYDGNTKTVRLVKQTECNLTGDTSATLPGRYTVTATISNPDLNKFERSGDSRTLTWVINTATQTVRVSKSSLTTKIDQSVSVSIVSDAPNADIIVTPVNGLNTTLINGVLTLSSNTAGTYTVNITSTATGYDDWHGSITVNVSEQEVEVSNIYYGVLPFTDASDRTTQGFVNNNISETSLETLTAVESTESVTTTLTPSSSKTITVILIPEDVTTQAKVFDGISDYVQFENSLWASNGEATITLAGTTYKVYGCRNASTDDITIKF